MSERRTGPLVKAVAEGVREDLGDIAAALEAVKLEVEVLGEASRALNGLADDCRGWANHIAAVVGEVQKAQSETPAKLLGQPIKAIVQSVNVEHVEAVTAARRKAS